MKQMKKILILCGSPRKNGNSDILCSQLAKGAQEAGHSTEKVYLNDLKVGACAACYGCRETKRCVQKDDMEALLARIVDADVLVLATPVYFYTMSAQMKTIIDRTLPRYLEITDKEVYFIATAAENAPAIERTMNALCGFTDCLPGAIVKGKIYGGGVYQKGEIEKTPAMMEAYTAGKLA